MNVVVDDTLKRLENYFSQSNFNSALRFNTINKSAIGRWANLTSGNGVCLFNIAFQRFEDLEEFVKIIGERCIELGNCIILAHTVQDMLLINNYWCTDNDLSSDQNEHEESLVDFNDPIYNH